MYASPIARDAVLQRCAQLHPRMRPLQFFSHVTAAALWRMPLPAWAEAQTSLHVGAIPPEREPRLPDLVVGHRMRLWVDELTLVDGLPVPSAAETWAQLGSILNHDDLVVIADDLRHRTLADEHALASAIRRLRRRGAVDLRSALDLSRDGVESPRETTTRLILVHGGLPDPEVNWSLFDRRGSFVARLDLAYPAYRVAVEYDGRHHADLGQFARDADRWEAIRDEGWTLIRVLGHHLDASGPHVFDRTRRALIAAGWRPGQR